MTDSADKHRPCPACGLTDPRMLFRQDFAMTDLSLLDGYDVVVCQRCGCGYADRIPDQADFDRYYRQMSKYEYHQRDGAESEFDRARLSMTADAIAQWIPARDVNVLDIGCSTGRLLAQLRERGFQRVLGLDPSPTCAAAARRLYDVDVRVLTLAELGTTTGAFDLVLMLGVLEHLRDFDSALEHLSAVLPISGALYVEAPDVTAFTDWPNSPFQEFSTEHINFFSPTSLDNMLGQRGFRRERLEQNYRPQSYGTNMANLAALYRRAGSGPIAPIRVDQTTETSLLRYIAQSTDEADRLSERVNTIVESGRPILVWGVGTHTSRLMATSRLPDANIVGFIESNARYQGATLHGRPILAPAELKRRSEAVLISSRVFQREITGQIRNDLGCSNELITLYDV